MVILSLTAAKRLVSQEITVTTGWFTISQQLTVDSW